MDAEDEREHRILKAAQEVFLRYGYARTTMQDIANEAGLSRPALYLDFPNKDSIFDAVAIRMNGMLLDQIRAGLGDYPTLRAKLGFACERWVVSSFELVAAQPDARDLFDYHRFAAVQRAYDDFAALLAEILATSAPFAAIDASPEELARTLVLAMRGLKDVARDADELRGGIDLLLDLAVAAVSPHP